MDQRQIDEVLERNNIIDVITSYLPLKKTGANYKTRCPFHEEKTASFVVSEKKQIFKCFGCGKGGNAIHFVQEYEKISFFEALNKLAQRAGIVIKQSRSDTQKRSRRDLIYSIYQLAGSFFQDNLEQHGELALRYLESRQISQKSIKEFQIGYALDSYASLRNYLLKNEINEKILADTGLFAAGGRDLFQQRLMFPISDLTGRIVAFGGRHLLDDQGGGKYVNSPTTDIYTKGNELYGLNVTKYNASQKDHILLTEGYTDLIRLFEAGFTNCAATLGTSLTAAQISLVTRFTSNLYLLYDGDLAGRKAAVRAAGNIIRQGASARIISLPLNEDPDSFLLKHQPADLEELIAKALPLTVFLAEDQTLQLSEEAKLAELLEILNDQQDEISRELFIREIASTFRLSEQAISSRLRKKKSQTVKKEQKISINNYREERNLLCMMLNDKMSDKKVAQALDSTYFFRDDFKKIFEIIMQHPEEGQPASSLVSQVEDETLKNIIIELLMAEPPRMTADDLIENLKLRKYEQELRLINERIQQNPQDRELFSQKSELKKKILSLDKKIVKKTLY